MKSRLLRILILFMLILIAMPFAYIFLDSIGQRIFTLTSVILLAYLFVYSFGGLSKFIIYLIYGAFALALIVLFPTYELAFVVIFTLIFIINPLANVEMYLNNKLKDIENGPIHLNIHGTRQVYYQYQRDMKDAYHLPQMRKVYTNKYYSSLRHITVIALISIGLFVTILEISNMTKVLNNFNFKSFFLSTYGVLSIIILSLLLYRKGFTSTLRALVLLIFPPIIFGLSISTFNPLIKWIFVGFVFVIGITLSIIALLNLYQRVTYEMYDYYDHESQMAVYANALYEPYVYDEIYNLVGIYQIHMKLVNFQKKFHDVLVYANYHQFFITAYTFDDATVTIYTNFHMKDKEKMKSFFLFLEKQFKRPVFIQVKEDKNKLIYQETFFHKTSYIVARALYLADLLKDLEIKGQIIVSFTVWFAYEEQIEKFRQVYHLLKLEGIKQSGYQAYRVDFQVFNVEYMIEQQIRDFLLNLMIYKGHYIRINVYY